MTFSCLQTSTFLAKKLEDVLLGHGVWCGVVKKEKKQNCSRSGFISQQAEGAAEISLKPALRRNCVKILDTRCEVSQ